MDEQLLRVLLAEYGQLASTFDKHATIGYTVIPIILTALGGYVILGQYKGDFAGLGISILLSLVITWVGISHSVLNRIGLRLIEIELRIRNSINTTNIKEPFFFTSYIGQGAPGFGVYFVLLAFEGIVVLCVSVAQWWSTMVGWDVQLVVRIVGVAIPIALNLVAIFNLCFVERNIEQQRLELISNFEVQRHPE